MACVIETVAYPSWWAAAGTVQVGLVSGGNSGSLSRADVELLPQGVAWDGILTPWSNVIDIQRLT